MHRAVETSDILDAENYIRRGGDDAAVCGFAPGIADDHRGLLDSDFLGRSNASDLNGKGHFENECSELPLLKKLIHPCNLAEQTVHHTANHHPSL